MKKANTDREKFFIPSEQLEELQWNFKERCNL